MTLARFRHNSLATCRCLLLLVNLFSCFLLLVFGCDVFFNMPLHPNPALFTYQLVNVPVQVMYFGPGKLVKVTCDWMAHFTQHLHQGWKLIDIFWDQGKRSHGGTIYNTSDSVSSRYPNTEKRVGNTTCSRVFLTKFKVFG